MAEVVHLRVEAEFQSAKAAYEQERQQLLRELKNTSLPEDKKSVIARLDECEQQFSRVYAEFRSGRRKYLIEEDERAKNRDRRDRFEPVERQEDRRRTSSRKKARRSKLASTAGSGKKVTAVSQQSAIPEIRYVNDSELRDLERQGLRVVRVYGNRADCVGCGKRLELTSDRQWKFHRNGAACNPDYTNVVFVKTGGPASGSKNGKGKPKDKVSRQKVRPKSKKAKKNKGKEMSDVGRLKVTAAGVEQRKGTAVAGEKKTSAAEKRKEKEITAALRDMTAGSTRRAVSWGAVRGRGAPVAITHVVGGGAMGSNRRGRCR